MVGSRSLRLVSVSAAVRERIVTWVAKGLAEDGFGDVSPSVLEFLEVLDCGVNVAAEVARSLGVSRQMVAKTVRELCDIGLLEQGDGKGRRKTIHFTERGELLMARVRQRLRDLDTIIADRVGSEHFDAAIEFLDASAQLLGSGDDPW